MVKCKYCHKEIDKETAYNPAPRMYYCNKECYELSETKNKKKYKPQKGTERRSCTDYIKEIYLNNNYTEEYMSQSFWAMIGSQLSNIVNEYNTKYSAIKYTLWYMIEIKGLNLFNENFNGSILNLVGFYLDEAKQYYKDTQQIKQEINNFNFDEKEIIVHRTISNKEKKEISFD